MANQRQQLMKSDLETAISAVAEKLAYRSQQKGMGTMASSHEILGIINEEVLEYQIEVHQNSDDTTKIEELKDIAVACIFGIASIQSGGIDW